jgi:hypothetical protein
VRFLDRLCMCRIVHWCLGVDDVAVGVRLRWTGPCRVEVLCMCRSVPWYSGVGGVGVCRRLVWTGLCRVVVRRDVFLSVRVVSTGPLS